MKRRDATALVSLLFIFFVFFWIGELRASTFFPVDPATYNTISKNGDFGDRKGLHTGIDIQTPDGTPVFATISGTIVGSGWEGSSLAGGITFAICDSESGKVTIVCHLKSITEGLDVGKTVVAGQQIALSDNTGNRVWNEETQKMEAEFGSKGTSGGNHVHYETRTINNGAEIKKFSDIFA